MRLRPRVAPHAGRRHGPHLGGGKSAIGTCAKRHGTSLRRDGERFAGPSARRRSWYSPLASGKALWTSMTMGPSPAPLAEASCRSMRRLAATASPRFALSNSARMLASSAGHRSLSVAFANLDLRGERRAHRFGEIVAGPRSAAVQIGAVSFLELRVLGRAAVADALRLAVRRLAIVAHGFIALSATASSSSRSTGACDEPGSASPWPLLSRPRLQSAENARVNSVSA